MMLDGENVRSIYYCVFTDERHELLYTSGHAAQDENAAAEPGYAAPARLWAARHLLVDGPGNATPVRCYGLCSTALMQDDAGCAAPRLLPSTT